ncbi:MAG: 1-deoxy-D-xylulose-5-phosphate reductoisomerase, partial [Pseudomonadota bacterium]
MKKNVAIFGATGSIGESSLQILHAHADKFSVHTLHAHSSSRGLAALVAKFAPKFAVISNEQAAQDCADIINDSTTTLLVGQEGLVTAAQNPEIDIAINGIVGMAGLLPAWHTIDRGGVLILANKECLACAGDMIMARARVSGAVILPSDSEHNAIHQVFPYHNTGTVRRLIITASGGPFFGWTEDTLHDVTPAQATNHPIWDMGQKISVDSASLMNKGLEVIEAHHLFAMPSDKIDVLVHPQSTVHSLVEFYDGSLLAQIGPQDMTVALANCLGTPDRLDLSMPKFDLTSAGKMEFYPLDERGNTA